MATCRDPIIPNTDISGIGVRVSFYAQAVFLALLSTRSVSSNETGNALSTLIITNLAYAVTTVSLGFKKDPDLSLYDGLVVFYLLSLSGIAVLFSLPQYNRYKQSDPVIKLLAILQSYVVLAADFAIVIAAPHFGTNSECNSTVIAVIFRPFPFHRGRIPLLVVLSVVTVAYTAVIVKDYREAGDYSPTAPPLEYVVSQNGHAGNVYFVQPNRDDHHRRHGRRFSTHSLIAAAPAVDGRIFVTVFFIIGFSAVAITNTELLIAKNKVNLKESQKWTFGQILPLFLTILSISNTIKAFKAYGCGPKPRRRQEG